MFICKPCEFKTKRKIDYERHILTSKHQKNIVPLTCDICKKTFTEKKNLIRHKNTVCEKFKNYEDYEDYEDYNNSDNNNSIEINKINKINKTEESNIIKNNKEPVDVFSILNKLVEEMETNRHIMDTMEKKITNISNNIDSSESDKKMTTQKYAEKHFRDAPVIKEIDITALEYDETENIKFVEEIIYHYNHNKIAEFIGNIVIDKYINEDNPQNQTIWCTDPSRLKFIIKEDDWIIDKDSKKIRNMIIDKILININNKLKTYIHICNSMMNNNETDIHEKHLIITKMEKATEIIIKIKDEIPQKILRFIAPNFVIDQIFLKDK
jgi:hypothetical protein